MSRLIYVITGIRIPCLYKAKLCAPIPMHMDSLTNAAINIHLQIKI